MTIIDTDTRTTPHLAALKARGVTAIGRYYARKGSKRLTKDEARAISDAGLKVFVVYEDSGDPVLSHERGRNDADVALAAARDVGQPAGSAIYFAMEHLPHGYGPEHVAGIKEYFAGIRSLLEPAGYTVGCYANGTTLAALLDAQLIEYAWVSASTSFHGSREFLKTDRWHLAQRLVDKNWDGCSIDTNDVQGSDFGAFTLPPVAATEMAGAVAGAAPASFVDGAPITTPLPPSYLSVAYKSRTVNSLAVFVMAVFGWLGDVANWIWNTIAGLFEHLPQIADYVRSNLKMGQEVAGWFGANFKAIETTVAVISIVVAIVLLLRDKRAALTAPPAPKGNAQ